MENTRTDRVVHDSEHWTNGGTGLTNFPPHQFPIYIEAAKRCGVEGFIVSSTRMLGRGRNADEGGSLHYVGDGVRGEAASAYWDEFAKVKAEMRDVYDGKVPA